MTSTALTRQARDAALAAMSDEEGVDVLVVGGGVTGAGIALDAATRGLRTAIVEAQDWAGGTSSRSSKLVHGGLRYLYQLDFKLVAEALKERGTLLSHHRPAPGQGPAVPVAAEDPGHRAGLLRRRGRHVRRPRPARLARPRRRPHPAPLLQGRRPATLPGHPRRLPRRRDPLLRRPGRRRPPGHRPRAHRRRLRRPGRLPHAGHRADQGPRGAGHRRDDPRPRDRGRPARCGRGTSSTPPGCGPRRPRPSAAPRAA